MSFGVGNNPNLWIQRFRSNSGSTGRCKLENGFDAIAWCDQQIEVAQKTGNKQAEEDYRSLKSLWESKPSESKK